MEKISTLLWILLGLGVYVYRLIKKAQETTARESRERPQRPGGGVPSLPPATFQEMLKQMQSRNAPQPDAPQQGGSQPLFVPRPAGEHTPGGRPLPRETARPARSQERVPARQRSLEAPATARSLGAPAPPPRRSAEMPRASARDNVRAVAPVAGPAVADNVRKLLREPESVQAAFVLSEILRRKYD